METPFWHQGRTIYKALDCLGHVLHVLKMVNYGHEEIPPYRQMPDRGFMLRYLERNLDPVENGNSALYALPGDILAFDPAGRGDPYHLAVYHGDLMLGHADRKARMVVEERVESVPGLHSAWRLIGL